LKSLKQVVQLLAARPNQGGAAPAANGSHTHTDHGGRCARHGVLPLLHMVMGCKKVPRVVKTTLPPIATLIVVNLTSTLALT